MRYFRPRPILLYLVLTGLFMQHGYGQQQMRERTEGETTIYDGTEPTDEPEEQAESEPANATEAQAATVSPAQAPADESSEAWRADLKWENRGKHPVRNTAYQNLNHCNQAKQKLQLAQRQLQLANERNSTTTTTYYESKVAQRQDLVTQRCPDG